MDKVPEIAPFVNGIKTEANANYSIYVASYKELQALFVRIEKSAVDKALGTIDPDALSPREALDALYKLKKILNQN